MNMATESTECAADWDKKDDFTLPTLTLVRSFSPLIFLLCPLLTSLLHQHFSPLTLCSFLFFLFFFLFGVFFMMTLMATGFIHIFLSLTV